MSIIIKDPPAQTANPAVHRAGPFMVVRPSAQGGYNFTPAADGQTVTVVYTTRGSSYTYNLSTDEARELWRRLRKRGYDRF
jgi:hypothetical protein